MLVAVLITALSYAKMVRFYPLSAFGENKVAASIDTPLHAFLPFEHVDHLHPDWGIALAASANGSRKLEEFNQQFGRQIVWLPWQSACVEKDEGEIVRDPVVQFVCDPFLLLSRQRLEISDDTVPLGREDRLACGDEPESQP